jgi:hypothetical protein
MLKRKPKSWNRTVETRVMKGGNATRSRRRVPNELLGKTCFLEEAGCIGGRAAIVMTYCRLERTREYDNHLVWSS